MSCAYQKRLDYISNYVRGELPHDERETFEAHYLGCDECFNAVRFVQKTSLTMRRYGAGIFAPAKAFASARQTVSPANWLDQVKMWCNDFVRSTQWKTAIPAFAAYVLVAAIVSGGYYWLKSSFSDQPDLPHHERSGEMIAESSPQFAFDLQPLDWAMPAATADTALFNRLANIQPIYQAQNYRLAADRLASVVQEFPQSFEAHLFLGISQLHLDQPAEAIENLKNVLQLQPEHAPAQWYLAQGFLSQRRFDEARQQLTALVKQRDSHYAPLAVACLKKLNK